MPEQERMECNRPSACVTTGSAAQAERKRAVTASGKPAKLRGKIDYEITPDNWYRRFDAILLTPADERTAEQQEIHAWLEAFDDTILGMPGRRDPRRLWCENAFAAQRVVRELRRMPDAADEIAPNRVLAWIAEQRDANPNVFQAAWWGYVQYLGVRRC